MTGPLPDLPASSCYRCGRTFEGHTGVAGTRGVPVEGDLAICQECGAIAVFSGIGMDTRAPTLAERREILADPEVVERISRIEIARRQAMAMGRDDLRRRRG